MTPVQILIYALTLGVAAILIAFLVGIAYMIWTSAVNTAHKNNNKRGE